MIRISFTAARELTGLHTAGTTVVLSFSAAELTPSRNVSKDEQRSLSGRRETLRHVTKRAWSITTGPLDGAALDEVIEFISSCDGGEVFTFEPWRHESGPSLDLDFTTARFRVGETIPCVLDGSSFQLDRLVGDGTGGANDVYQVSFQVAEA